MKTFGSILIALAACARALTAQTMPANVSVTPYSGSGANQTFTFVSSDAAGYSDLAWMQVIINYGIDAAGACFLHIPLSGEAAITSDTGWTYGGGWGASGTLGSSGTISNSQCTLNLASSSLTGSGNTLTATLNITFNAGLPGPQQIIMRTGANSGLIADWQWMGSWTPSSVIAQPPTVDVAGPTSGTGLSQTFSYTASSVNGYQYLTQVQALLLKNTAPNNANSCWVSYNRLSNAISLMNDAANAWITGSLKTVGTLSNSQCTVDTGLSQAIPSGNNLTLDLVITFNSSWTGDLNNWSYAGDRGGNWVMASAPGTWTVGSPAITVDPRRTGLRPTGNYWGDAGEQIDMLSGNLNFSAPALKLTGRTGWTVPLNLSYNSQNWRQDNGVNLSLGADVGYGFGWQMQIGSITPHTAVTQSADAIDYYLYTDGTGAQYKLDVPSGSVWGSTQGVYVWYDSSTAKLHFKDGTFWTMGSLSSSGEADYGALYPTVIEDVNGNQILITYMAGTGLPVASANTSARIASVDDVRKSSYCSGQSSCGIPTYSFSYNGDVPIPHLVVISNTIRTAENYSFNYSSAALAPPFGSSDPAYSGITTAHLISMTVPPIGSYQFTYDSAGGGELDQVVFPYGGHLRWVYQNFQYLGGRTMREISSRYAAVDYAGLYEWGQYPFTHYDAQNSVPAHAVTTLIDASGVGAKTWCFATTGAPWQIGLITDFFQANSTSGTPIQHDSYSWNTNSSNNPFISQKVSILDEATGSQQSAFSTQAVDAYGNVTQSKIYPYNNATTPLKTYDNIYLYDPTYASHYIFNRLLNSTYNKGTPSELVVAQNYYDGKTAMGQPSLTSPASSCLSSLPDSSAGPGVPAMDFDSSQPIPFTFRGQLNVSVDPARYSCLTYSPYGFYSARASDGSAVTASSVASNNYAAPTTITTQTYGQTLQYNEWLGVTQATGLNGEQLSIAYDNYGRPQTATSPYGAVTAYTYSSGSPVQQTRSGPDGVTRTTLDGFGRVFRTERGSTSGYTSVVDTGYAPCACSPLGKIQTVSAPYPYGQSATAWTVYSYDGTGRTLSTVLPDGQSTTHYSYSGNTTTVTDPAGKTKTFTNDVLGNLTSVVEPDPANQPSGTLITSYTYDWMNHLNGVSMPRSSGTQTRSFTYDNAGRLTQATNPENGTVSYYYNSDNTLQYKHDAKGQETVYTYDSKKRVTQVQQFPSGQGAAEDTCHRVTYSYDTNPLDGSFSQYSTGRLTTSQYSLCVTAVPSMNFSEQYSYHPAGGVTTKRYQMLRAYDDDPNSYHPPANLDVKYTYNAAGQTATTSYATYANEPDPYGEQPVVPTLFTYGYDSMGRPISVRDDGSQGWTDPVTWVQSVQYDYVGRLSTWSHLYDLVSPYYTQETESYNVNGQLSSINWNVAGAPGFSGSQQYTYSLTQNNGQITQMTDTLSGQMITYQYDALKRLTSASASPTSGSSSPAWAQTFQYDGFGNLTAKVLNGATTSIPAVAGTNRLASASYDNNGNMTAGAGATYTFDEANRITSATSFSGGTEYYGYAPDNKRTYRLEADGHTEEFTFYGAKGERLGVYWLAQGGPGPAIYRVFVPLRKTVWFGGKRAWEDKTATAGAVLETRLGSDLASGNYYPYGEDITATANDRTKFATYHRDSFTGLDYADQRYYASSYARFNTPDPYQLSAGIGDPGSWNRYSYTRGDPANRFDPRGTDDCNPGIDDDKDESCIPYCNEGDCSVDIGAGAGESDQVNGPVYTAEGAVFTTTVTAPASPDLDPGANYIFGINGTLGLAPVGAFLGNFFGPVGTVVGWVFGSMCGVGLNVSVVPSTHTLYMGFIGTCGVLIGSGKGVSGSIIRVPKLQNVNAIANGRSYSLGFQPRPSLGSTVTISPGSGPPVTGITFGTRNPGVAASAGWNMCLMNCQSTAQPRR